MSVITVSTGRIKELMSAPAECHKQLEEFLAPYEELRWLHELQTRQYHSAYSTLTVCASAEGQCLSKQKVYYIIGYYRNIIGYVNQE